MERQNAPKMLDWAAMHGGYIMIKRFGFPLLICAAFLASSSLDSAHAVPKGSSCDPFIRLCDAGLSCSPLTDRDDRHLLRQL